MHTLLVLALKAPLRLWSQLQMVNTRSVVDTRLMVYTLPVHTHSVHTHLLPPRLRSGGNRLSNKDDFYAHIFKSVY